MHESWMRCLPNSPNNHVKLIVGSGWYRGVGPRIGEPRVGESKISEG